MMKLKSKINSNDIAQYFEESSEYLNLLSPLLTALGWRGSFRDLLESLPEQKKSIDIIEFRSILSRLNFNSYKLNKSLSKIDNNLAPFLFIPDDSPAMIVSSISNNEASILNSVTQKPETLDIRNTKGTAYIFSDKKNNKLENTEKKSAGWLKDNINSLGPLSYQVIFVSFLLSTFTIATPLFIMSVYDRVLRANSLSMLITFSIGITIILIGSLLLHANRGKIIALFSTKISYLTTESIFDKILFLPPKYTESASVGSQISRIKDFDTIKDFFNNPISITLFELPAIVASLAVILFLSTKLFFVAVGLVTLYACVYFVLNIPCKQFNQKYLLANHHRQTFQTEALTNIYTIKAYASEEVWKNRYKDIFSHATIRGLHANFFSSVINIIAESMILLAGIVIVWLGAIEVLNEALSVGALIAIMMLTWKILSPIKNLFHLLPQLNQMKTSILQVDKLLSLETEKNTSLTTPWPQTLKGNLEFSKLYFRYNLTDPLALTNITLTVPANEITCITGDNGSGKSTLLKLIAKMYQPQTGIIKIDDINIQQLPPILHRQTISYLPQTPQVFNTSIKQNMLYMNPTATSQEIVDACKLVGIYEKIMKLPSQFQTNINCEENNLIASNSFKQKLSLARTFLRKSPIYLFDEPTNSLDDEEITDFIKTINNLKNSATILIVTHQPKLLSIANQVVYLKNGEIIEHKNNEAMGDATEVIMKSTSDPNDNSMTARKF